MVCEAYPSSCHQVFVWPSPKRRKQNNSNTKKMGQCDSSILSFGSFKGSKIYFASSYCIYSGTTAFNLKKSLLVCGTYFCLKWTKGSLRDHHHVAPLHNPKRFFCHTTNSVHRKTLYLFKPIPRTSTKTSHLYNGLWRNSALRKLNLHQSTFLLKRDMKTSEEVFNRRR